MKVFNLKIVSLTLVFGLLSACGSQSTKTTSASPSPTVAAAAQAPTNAPAATQLPVISSGVSFTNDILPIFNNSCINCHGGNRTEKGLILKTYADLMKGSQNGSVVTAGDADHSKLAQLVISQKMPKRGAKLTAPQIQLIVDWINQGALDN